MERLDVMLVKKNIVTSRSKAQMEIKNNNVSVNGKVINKCSFLVSDSDNISINAEVLKYVSRGGLKLEKAIKCFNINLKDKVLLDIGSSTGGFTDCAIQNGIKEVICVDVGKDQLDDKIRNNEKVHVFENIDIRSFDNEILSIVDIVSIDISFISVIKIINKLKEINAYEIILLIKPEFECGKEVADKYKGVVLNKEVHYEVINRIIQEFRDINYYLKDITYSPVKGGNGNIEYLAYFNKINTNNCVDIIKLVNDAFREMR